MFKRIICILLSLTLCSSLLVACNGKRKAEAEYALKFAHETQMMAYAMGLRFISDDGTYFGFSRYFLDCAEEGNLKEFVFVKSREEASDYADNVIVCWPSQQTETILYFYNKHIAENNIDLTPFSLTYPITLTDAIDNWESTMSFIASLDTTTKDYYIHLPKEFDYWTMATYASNMQFDSTVGSGESIKEYLIDCEKKGIFPSVILVNSREEASDYGEKSIVAWPSDDTERVLDTLNKNILENPSDLAMHTLSYPITMEDVVGRWESISTFLIIEYEVENKDHLAD